MFHGKSCQSHTNNHLHSEENFSTHAQEQKELYNSSTVSHAVVGDQSWQASVMLPVLNGRLHSLTVQWRGNMWQQPPCAWRQPQLPTVTQHENTQSEHAWKHITLSVLAHLWKDIFLMSSPWFSGMHPDRMRASIKSSSIVLNWEFPTLRWRVGKEWTYLDNNTDMAVWQENKTRSVGSLQGLSRASVWA